MSVEAEFHPLKSLSFQKSDENFQTYPLKDDTWCDTKFSKPIYNCTVIELSGM